MGDRVLKLFAQVATEALRPNDLFSRVGGEEFTAIFPKAGLQAGCAMAERIRKAFEEMGAAVDDKPLGSTVSVGVTASDDPGVPLSSMLERADEALYKAKLAGRNRIECADADCRAKTYPRLVRVA
jgi:diguanylate cyclase (GGDEF)-like protein